MAFINRIGGVCEMVQFPRSSELRVPVAVRISSSRPGELRSGLPPRFSGGAVAFTQATVACVLCASRPS